MIPAFLKGVAKLTADLFGSNEIVAIRGENGAPRYSYKGGEWFFGVYFGGASGGTGGAIGDYTGTLAVNVDITRCVHRVPTGKQGDWIAGDDDLYARASRLSQRLMNPDYVVANACNEFLWNSNDPAGKFYDHFDTFSLGNVRGESCEWIGAAPDDKKCPAVLVLTLALAGLSFTKVIAELPK